MKRTRYLKNHARYVTTFLYHIEKMYCSCGYYNHDLITGPFVYKDSQKPIFKHKLIRFLLIQTITSPTNQNAQVGKYIYSIISRSIKLFSFLANYELSQVFVFFLWIECCSSCYGGVFQVAFFFVVALSAALASDVVLDIDLDKQDQIQIGEPGRAVAGSYS